MGRPTRRHHALIYGVKITTIGVLFRNADIVATTGRIAQYPFVIVQPLLGNRWRRIGVSDSLRRIPSLTRKSSATVTIPRFEKPASACSGVSIPVTIKSTTTEKRIIPGRRYSLTSRKTIIAIAESIMQILLIGYTLCKLERKVITLTTLVRREGVLGYY